jgi:adenylate kinase family enzyme
LEVSTINALFDMFATLVSPEQSMLLDGFPRNMPNMYHFLAHERKLHRNVMGIYLDLNKNVAIQRLLNRYYYKKDGHLYPVLPKDIEQYKAE